MNKYRVLWFDDKYEDYANEDDMASQKGIELIGFDNSEEGLIELTDKYDLYDAVIIDGLFYKNPEEQGDPNVSAFSEVALKMRDFKSRGIVIPWFIYSGAPGFINDERSLIDALKEKEFADGRIYDKAKKNDFELLCEELISCANELDSTNIRNRYQSVFSVCNDYYIGEQAAQDLLKLLNSSDKLYLNSQFNTIRKIVEDIFIAFNKFQLLPNEFITPSVALNQSSKFLSGISLKGELFSEKGYEHLAETHIPTQISSMLRNILSITQNGSHRSTIDQHVKIVNTSYLIQSVLYQLFDVIVWFKIHIDANPKIENWTKIVEKEKPQSKMKKGVVINLNVHKGFAFLKPEDGTDNVFIPPNLVTDNKLKQNDPITGEIEEYIDNRTNEPMKRVKKLIN